MSTDLHVSRRDCLRLSAAGVLAGSASGWLPRLARGASVAPTAGAAKSCILLWMNGGPSQHHTFSPPEVGGEYKTIPTALPGVQFCEYLPKLAKLAPELALVRSMSTPEAEHERARSMLHDGRRVVPGETFPALGAVASKELGRADAELPNFVTIDGGTDGANGPGFYRPIASYLGPRHEPLRVADPAKGVEHLRPAVPAGAFDDGVALADKAGQRFRRRYGAAAAAAEAHDAALRQAVMLLRSERVKAFDLSLESPAARDAYGDSKFGQACLMARRLTEVGVPFVEVTLAGWDDHGGAGKEVKRRCEYMDGAIAALLTDLKQRGTLDRTLVVWMGEFGRSPGKGDGHYAKAWTTWLAGAGLKVGQVIGRTDKKGGTVEDRPVGAADFMATLCQTLGIDYHKEYETADGRPMRVVEEGAKVIGELFA